MKRELTGQERLLLGDARDDEDHVVFSRIDNNEHNSALLSLRGAGLLQDGPRFSSPFHDAYKLTREGLKVARSLAKEEV